MQHSERKKLYLDQMQHDPSDKRHGTLTGYSYGCRCRKCKTAYGTSRRSVAAKPRRRFMYVAYRGDHPIGVFATKQACAEFLGVKPETVLFYTSPAYRKRKKEQSVFVEKVESYE